MIRRKKSLCKNILIILLIFTCSFPTVTYADSSYNIDNSQEFSKDIKQILECEVLNGAIGSVVVRSAQTGEIIFSYNEDIRLNPASNLKLITGAAALDTLGKDYRFKTELYTDGILRKSILNGNLYLKGTGDPTMLKKDYESLVDELIGKGIKKIEGNLIIDDTYFDHVRLSNDMEWGDEPYAYGAQISALTISPDEDYDSGTVIVTVKPGEKIGSPAIVEIIPENDYVTIENKGITTSQEESSISVEREHGTNKIIVNGHIPLQKDIEEKNYISVWEPTRFVASIFSGILKEKGIEIKGDLLYEKTPDHTTLIAQRKSVPLSKLFIPFQKLSNNGHAEILVKTMGKIKFNEGSWDKGLDVVEEYLKKTGMNGSSIRLRDGSGLSRHDLISTKEISQLLYAIQNEEWFDVLFHSLPIAGVEERMVGGTLRNRMKGTQAQGKVHAKTGSMTSVSAISGYITEDGKNQLIFSIISNNFLSLEDKKSIKDIEDELIIYLLEFKE